MSKNSKTVVQAVLVIVLSINIWMILTNGLGLPIGIFVIRGDSMEPMLHRYDAIVTLKTSFSELETSDVIVFKRKDEFVTHEIIQTGKDFVITKGLANGLADDPVKEDAYHSKMLFRIPYLGILAVIYESPVLLMAFVAIAAVLIFGFGKK